MINILLCAPQTYLDGLLNTLSADVQLPSKLLQVGFTTEESDSEIYRKLVETTSELNDDSALLILGEQLGSRGSTLALSLPYEKLIYISGVNLPMVQQLDKIISDILSRKINSNDLMLQLVAERILEQGRSSMICSNDLLKGGGDESTVEMSTLSIASSL